MMQENYRISSNGGFTLIEIMLVTVIIGILAGMVVVVFAGQATDARVRTALGDIKLYESALDMYALDHNDKYPSSLDALVSGEKQYVRDLNKDPWGNPYNYMKPGTKHPRSYDLFSSGPDGVKGTEDDVAQWLMADKKADE